MVFPPTTLDEAARERARFALMATDAAQPAVGAASVGMLDLLRSLGIAPSAVAGHSFGELVALHAAGAMDVDAIARLSEARGRLMAAAAGAEPGTMAALLCDAGRASGVISGIEGVVVANLNGPRQTVLSGNRDALNRAIDRARGRGIRCFDLPVGGAFHSPIVAEASGPMAVEALRAIGSPPSIPVYSNLDAAPHPGDPAEIARRLGGHLASPVRFGAMIESMYESGVRCFIECGPGAALGPMVGAILGDRPHLAVSTDAPGRPGIPTLLTALGRLIASGIPVRRLSRLTGRRGGQRIDPDRMPTAPAQPPPSTWLVNGSRARPVGGPEPRRLGMAPELIGGPGPGAREDGLGHAGSNGHRASESIADGLARRSGCPGGGEMPPIGTEEGDELPGIRGNAAMNRRGVDRPAPCDPELVSGSRSRQISEGRMQIPAIPVDSRRSPERNGHPAPERNGHDPGPGPGPSSAAPRSGPHGDSHPDRVMEAFQETMRAFLEVQRSTMQAYLSGRGAGEARPGDLPGRSGGEVDSAAGVDGRVDRAPAGDHTSGYADAFEGDRARLPATRPLPESGPKRAQAPAAAMGEHASISGRAAERPEFDGRIEVGEPTRDQDSSHGRPGGRPAGRVAERLLEIVRDRTGYPAEMLGMSLDLEADLGIDSIKRVEILGKLRDSIEGMAVVSGSGLMDRLSRSRTLGEIVSQVETALEVGAGPPTASPSDDGGGAGRLPASGGRPADKASGRSLRRMTLRAVDAPMAGVGPGLAPGGAVVLTDDGRGVADALAAALGREGLAVRVARAGWADPTSPSSVSAWLDRARGDAPLAGIIHAQPLGEVRGPGLDPTMWSDRLDHSLRGLFHLARAAAGDLERSSRRGGACVIAATSMGGAFGSIGGLGDGTFPGDGAIGGLIKTLAREWPTVRTRVVDLDPAESDRTIAGRLAIEAMRDDGWSEVGYLAGRRIRLGAVERPLDTAESDLEIKEGEPILITGGARGITASVAVELARRWRPTLLLVGSSPMPPESEGTETARLAPGSDLKAAVLREARGASGEVSPAELERAYRALLRSREIRATIGRIRDAGARVEYASVDVRDASALAGVLEGWRRRFGEPVGLIHGAGIIQDRLLREKTPESFDAVFGTKVEGALNLVRLIRGDALRFTALFSSVSGRFGNEGQSDYSAANEALNKLALRLDRQWPGRVVSLNWGPWAGVGMVADLEGHLGRRGLGMIDPATGCAALVDELRFGRKGDVEVILAGELGDLEAAPRAPIRTPEGAAR
jgi:malonyl CoA-acyl carrier protein transacylase